MENINRKIFFSFTLIFLLCLSISSIYAEDLRDDSSNICEASELSNFEISDTQDIEEVPLEESSNVELDENNEDISEERLNSLDNMDDNQQLTDEDNSKNNKNVLSSSESSILSSVASSSSSSSNVNYTIRNTKVWLVDSFADEGYILSYMEGYYNSKVKFLIEISDSVVDEYGGKVTLKLNGKSYTANIFDGKTTIVVKAPSKVGSYKASLRYSGCKYDWGTTGYIYNPSSSTFTFKVKKCPTIVSAPKVTAKHKKSKYFKVKIKNKLTKKALKYTKITLKVYTGKKYRTYKVKTNSKGIAKLNTKRFSVGSHKVIIRSANKNYKIKKTSKIIIKKSKVKTKKKSSHRVITMPTRFDRYCTKYVGNYKIQTYKFKATLYQEVDVFLYKNSNWVNRYKFKSKVYYKRYGKYSSTKWSHGYENSAYHKYQTGKDTIITKVKVRL